MKKSKRVLSLLVAAVLLIVICPICVNAVTVKTIAADTYITVTSNKNIYKLTVPGEGYVTVYAKVSASKSGSAYVYGELVNSKKKPFDDNYTYFSADSDKNATGSAKYAVSKGTYYINIDNLFKYGSAKVQIKYTFKSVTQPKNYCIGNAETLNSGKYVQIYQTPNMTFDRWYKIKLTSAKKLTITFKDSSYHSINVFDKDGNIIDINQNEGKCTSKSKLSADTYYICIDTLFNVPFTSEVISFKWS